MGVVVHDGGACGSDQCDGGGVGGCGCVVVIVFLPETGSEPQQRCDCRFTYVCQTFARATHLSDSLCLSDYVFWFNFSTSGIKMKTMEHRRVSDADRSIPQGLEYKPGNTRLSQAAS